MMLGFFVGMSVGLGVAIYGNPRGWSFWKQIAISVPLSLFILMVLLSWK